MKTSKRAKHENGKRDDDEHENDNHDNDEHDNGKPGNKQPCFPPIGACFPVVPGAKHKLSRENKLAQLAEGIRVPSSLAAGTIHMARRFLLKKKAANPLEKKVFAALKRLPRDLLSCTMAAFDTVPPAQRDRLFAKSLLLDPNKPIDDATWSDAITQEIVQRVGIEVFGDPNGAEEERPGVVRVHPPGGEIPLNQVRICKIKGLRTSSYVPFIPLEDLLPAEVQRDCEIVIVDGQPEPDCKNLTTNCPGHSKGDLAGNQVCMRVLDIATGESVDLEGVNFFSIDAKVRFNDIQTGTAVRDVDTHVWGDIDTPLNEVIGGETVLINDCRVHDRLTFQVPDDLPAALYRIQVVVPNVTGNSDFGPDLNSDEEYINVIPPATARFEVVIERIDCKKETSPEWLGSDELGMHTLAAAVDLNFELIELPDLVDPNTRAQGQQRSFEEDDFDSGEHRDTPRKIFTHDQPILGMLLVVLGDEIDSEDAYENQITSSMDIFLDVVKAQVIAVGAALAAGIGTGKITLKDLLKFAAKHPVLLAIAAAIILAIDIIYALWAPADPLIRDSIGLSVSDLDALTSISVPSPDPTSYVTEDGIRVSVNMTVPPVKHPLEYHETREYLTGGDFNPVESRYEITYRYNRVA